MDIFISYSRADRERVDYIAKALQAEGYEVWWDRDIRAGEEFDHVIDKAIKSSKAIIVVWSNQSINSRWVKEEAEDGVETDTLVPITIDQVVIPRGFRRIQAAELQDGGEDPTKSANWPEFLDSVRKLAGPATGLPESGTPKTQAELLDDITSSPEATASVAAVQSPAPSAAAASNDTNGAPVWKRYWPAAASVVGIVVAGLLALQMFGGRSAPPPPDDMSPVVLSIFPSDGFGVNQAEGLKASFRDTPSVTIRDLTATIDEMKGRDAPELMEGLRTNLAQRNVIAIVGPTITEFTPSVLEVVEESGRSPAILLTTAASRGDLGWEQRDLPLFRVRSGVDERSEQFARLAQNTIESGVELVLMVESVPNSAEPSYGELFFRGITDRLPQWSDWYNEGRVRTINFRRGQIMDSFELASSRQIFDENKMIIVLGYSTDFKVLVENFYASSEAPRAALLGGWNTSRVVQQVSNEMDIQHNRLFSMDEIRRSPADTRGLPDSRRFEAVFGPLTPSLTSEAIAFDSGLVIKQAIAGMGGDITSERLVETLRTQRFNGVTGEIAFNDLGQNSGQAGGTRPLYNLRYNPSATDWTEIENFDALLGRVVASN
ncbi:TIR domain-containing protein [Erythrobacter sp. Alg231-14]|uniref:TIR domain-containing protein n=1 Tax=Erythrobacter sp. Alg231-14 TaxID=1922225 RepID=UPI000D55B5A5